MNTEIEVIKNNGFWFIDVPRTSSTSIRYSLGSQFGSAYGKYNVIEAAYRTKQAFNDHSTAMQMREIFGDEMWSNLFTFSIVRNPFDRAFSLYNFLVKRNKIPGWSFKYFISVLGEVSGIPVVFKSNIHRYSAADFLSDKKGNIIVSFVGKFENREQDLKKIASEIGVEALGDVLLQKASPKKYHYSEFYDREMKEIIYKRFRKDIELFEYEF